MSTTELDSVKLINEAWKRHLKRCQKTQDKLDAAAQAHALIHQPSLMQYQAEYAEATGITTIGEADGNRLR